jgi:hypothetical protein
VCNSWETHIQRIVETSPEGLVDVKMTIGLAPDLPKPLKHRPAEPHVDAVCEHLQAMIEDRIKDLIINNPPELSTIPPTRTCRRRNG